MASRVFVHWLRGYFGRNWNWKFRASAHSRRGRHARRPVLLDLSGTVHGTLLHPYRRAGRHDELGNTLLDAGTQRLSTRARHSYVRHQRRGRLLHGERKVLERRLEHRRLAGLETDLL